MKRKLVLFISLVISLICLFAVTAFAADMTEYCTAKVTLTDGTEHDVYFAIGEYGGKPTVARDTIYKSLDKSSTISWSQVKIMDMSKMVVVSPSGKVPAYLAGTGCNSQATNVEVVYLPPMINEVLGSSFTSAWKSLKTVYISKSVQKLASSSFSGSAVQEVVIEKGSELLEINGAFQGCKKLTSINLQDATKLQYIDHAQGDGLQKNAFSQCSSLTTITFPESLIEIGYNAFYQSGLTGTIVVPNSVEKLGPGAFLETNINTLVLGDGVNKIGFNFLSFTKTIDEERRIYLSAETTTLDNRTSEIWKFGNSHNVKFYVIGKNTDTAVNWLKTAPASSSYHTINDSKIVVDTNVCEVFYKNSHAYEYTNEEVLCEMECSRCDSLINEGVSHVLLKTFNFSGEAYFSPCVVKMSCDCGYSNGEGTTIDAIFIWLGYSYPEIDENTTSVAMEQRFHINKTALALYESEKGTTLDYGLVAAQGTNENPIIVNENGASANDSVIASMQNTEFSYFSLKIANIDLEKIDIDITFCGYVVENGSLTYLSESKASNKVNAISYSTLAGIKK